jgi:hypothetical protein
MAIYIVEIVSSGQKYGFGTLSEAIGFITLNKVHPDPESLEKGIAAFLRKYGRVYFYKEGYRQNDSAYMSLRVDKTANVKRTSGIINLKGQNIHYFAPKLTSARVWDAPKRPLRGSRRRR